jgi:hypothetical protein
MLNLKCSWVSAAILISVLLAACGGGGGGAGSGGGNGNGSGDGGVPAASVGLIALPKTGVIRCADATSSEIVDCANTGQDGELKAGVAWPNPRFTVDGTGHCITDNLTGLMWARQDGGFRTWQLALDFVSSLELCGFTDWRMPNRKELLSLVNYGAGNQGIWLTDNDFTFQVESVLWTSSSVAGSAAEAWTLIVLPGIVSQKPKSDGNYVLPVRAGK